MGVAAAGISVPAVLIAEILLLVAVDDKGHVPAGSDAFVKVGLTGALLAELARRPRRWREPRMLRHGGGWPPLTSAAVPVTLPSRVMVSCASAWPST